ADARPAAGTFFTKLGFAGGPLAVLERAHADAPARAARGAGPGRPPGRARRPGGAPPPALARAPRPRDRPGPRPPVSVAGLDPRVLSLSGDAVVALGAPRGPAVARVLAEMRDARLDGRLASRAMEEAYVRQWIAKGG